MTTYLTKEEDRRNSIINNTNEKFYFEHQEISDVAEFADGIFENQVGATVFGVPLYLNLQDNSGAGEYIRNNNATIVSAANEFGVDANLVKATIYTEMARGWYDTYNIFGSSTVLPGNISEEWEQLIPGSDVNNEIDNIRLSAALLSRIEERLDNPHPEDVYSLYNGLAHDRTYINAETKSTPYFYKQVLDAEAWQYDNWALPNEIDLPVLPTDGTNIVSTPLFNVWNSNSSGNIFNEQSGFSWDAPSFDFGSSEGMFSERFYATPISSISGYLENVGLENSVGGGEWQGANDYLNDFTFDFVNDTYTYLTNQTTVVFDAIDAYFPSTLLTDTILSPVSDLLTLPFEFFGGLMNHVSPLVLDLDGDGVELTHTYDENVYFDIDADGFAERVGWVGPDDGQLAMDWNGNGTIDDITELYGDDQMPAFDKLRLHDTNLDGVIDANDDDFDKFLVWRDLNMDGISQAEELSSLTGHDIVSISLDESEEDYYVNENYVSSSSTYQKAGGELFEVVDAHYLNDNINTWYKGAESQVFGSQVEVNLEALLLPQSRGYGSLASMHLALSDDPVLSLMMSTLATMPGEYLNEAPGLVEDILLQWAGVFDNDPDARSEGLGSNIDARKVDFLEEFGGVTWLQRGASPDVGVNASLGIQKAFSMIHGVMTQRFLVQGPLKEIFPDATYEFASDQLLLNATLDEIVQKATPYSAGLTEEQARTFWLQLGDILILNADELNADTTTINTTLSQLAGEELFIGEKTITADNGVIYTGSDGEAETLSIATRVGTDQTDVISGGGGGEFIFGEDGDDTLLGNNGHDFLSGGNGDDRLEGGGDNDRLEGGSGDDVLDGGADRDILRGGEGQDQLFGGAGNDNISGGDGADTIDGGEGTDQLDYNDSDGAVYVNLAAGAAAGSHAEGDTFTSIEGVNGSQFADVLIGDGDANLINGEGGDDLIYGGDGNDYLFGATGDDVLFGQGGDDHFVGFDGSETFDGGKGIDTVAYNHPFDEEGVIVDLSQGRGFSGAAAGDVYVGIENITGSNNHDLLIGDDGDNVIAGLRGLDVVIGGGGNDILISSSGEDELFGGTGSDTFFMVSSVEATADDNQPRDNVESRKVFVQIRDQITTIHDFDLSDPNEKIDLSHQMIDQILLQQYGQTDTLIMLDGGRKVLVKNALPDELTIDQFVLPDHVAQIVVGTPLTDNDQIKRGSDLANSVSGSLGSDVLEGLGSDDILYGSHGDDHLSGGAGNDALVGGKGADTLDGGADTDVVGYALSHEAIAVDLAAGTASGGTAAGDTLVSIEGVNGSRFDDVLSGDSHDNLLSGHEGDDILNGRGGDNTLSGGAGDDRFVIEVDPGSTTTIRDYEFDNSGEKIDLSAFDFAGGLLEVEKQIDWSHVVLQLPDDQKVIIEFTGQYQGLGFDDFVFADGQAPGLITTQTVGTSGFDLFIGTDNDDVHTGMPTTIAEEDVVAGDYFQTGEGNDTVISNTYAFDYIKITRGSGIHDAIYRFRSESITTHVEAFSPNNLQIVFDESNQTGITELENAKIDLTDFPDIRSFSDLDITTSGGDTVVDLGAGQTLTLKNYVEGNHVLHTSVSNGNFHATLLRRSIDSNSFEFYDGEYNGTHEDENLVGGAGADMIDGSGGDDILEGNGGNDNLTGGDGADRFIILANSNTTDIITDFEYWNPGETVDLSAFSNIISGFTDISARLSQEGDDVVLDLENGQKLIFSGLEIGDLSYANFSFADETVPTSTSQLEVLEGTERDTYSFNADDLLDIVYSDEGSHRQIVSMSSDHGRVQSVGSSQYTLWTDPDFEGEVILTYEVFDGFKQTPAQTTLNLIPRNDAPTFSGPVDLGEIDEDNVRTITEAELLAHASDAEGDPMSVTSVSVDASVGMVELVATGQWLFTPLSNLNGEDFEISFVVSDGENESEGSAILDLRATEDAPEVNNPLADHALDEDVPILLILPEDSFADVDGDALTLTATQSDGSNLPDWLTFDDATRTFSGTPPEEYSGTFELTVTASDGTSDVSDTFTLEIVAVNDAPVVSGSVDLGRIDEDNSRTITEAELLAHASDAEGDSLSVTSVSVDASVGAVELVSDGQWLFTPLSDLNGDDFEVSFVVSDGESETPGTAILDLWSKEDAPEVNNPLADHASDEDVPILLALPDDTFADVDGDALTLSATLADGTALPDWLVFDAVAGSFSGTPPQDFNGMLDLKVTASDGTYDVSDTFTLEIVAVNDAPVVSGSVDLGGIDEDNNRTITEAELLAHASDADGEDSLSVTSVSVDVSVGTIELVADGQWLFTPSPDLNGDDFEISFVVSDGESETPGTAILDLWSIEDAPEVNVPLADHASDEDVPVLLTLPDDTFADVDGDVLTLTATQGDGSNLPDWLAFDVTTRTFSGTPPQDFNGTLALVVTASDGTYDVSDTFTLEIVAVNDAPENLTLTGSEVQEEDAGAVIGTLSVSDPDVDDTFTYSVDDDRFEVSGNTLKLKDDASLDYEHETQVVVTVTATDSGDLSTSKTFILDVGDVYDPVVNVHVLVTETSRVATLSGTMDYYTMSTDNGLIELNALGGGATVGGADTFRFEDDDSEFTISLQAEQRVSDNLGTDTISALVRSTALANGGYVATWTSGQADAAGFEVHGRVFSASGTPIGDELVINTMSSGDQQLSSAAGLNDGGFVVVWQSDDQDGSGQGIYGQRFDASGGRIGDEFQLNTETVEHQSAPDVAALNDGGFVAVWYSNGQDGDQGGIFGQRFSQDGTPSGSEFQVNTHTAGRQDWPTVTVLTDGSFVVSWQSNLQDGDLYGIYGQRFYADGTPLGAEFHISTQTASEQTEPSITALEDGGFVVTWQSLDQDGAFWGVYGQKYNADGSAAGGEFQINTATDYNQYYVSVSGLQDGGFVATWTSYGQDESGASIHGQRYAADGSTVGGEFQVNTQWVYHHQMYSDVVGLEDGGFAISWHSYGQINTPDGYEIYSQRFDADGNKVILTTFNGGDGDDTLNLSASSNNETLLGMVGDDRLTGGSGEDALFGHEGMDTLSGGGGNDTLTGGSGDDTFSFDPDFGKDVITDFVAGVATDDVIEFRGITNLASYTDVLNSAADDGTDTTITLDTDNSIVLKNVVVSDLSSDDFRFHA